MVQYAPPRRQNIPLGAEITSRNIAANPYIYGTGYENDFDWNAYNADRAARDLAEFAKTEGPWRPSTGIQFGKTPDTVMPNPFEYLLYPALSSPEFHSESLRTPIDLSQTRYIPGAGSATAAAAAALAAASQPKAPAPSAAPANMTTGQAMDYLQRIYKDIAPGYKFAWDYRGTPAAAPQQAPVQQRQVADTQTTTENAGQTTQTTPQSSSDRIREIIRMMKEEQGAAPTYQPVQPRNAAEFLKSLLPQQQPLPRWAQIADMAGQAFLNAGAVEPFQRARALDAQRRSDITESRDKATRQAFAILEAQLGLDKFAADSANDQYRNALAARELEQRTMANALDLYRTERGLETDQQRLLLEQKKFEEDKRQFGIQAAIDLQRIDATREVGLGRIGASSGSGVSQDTIARLQENTVKNHEEKWKTESLQYANDPQMTPRRLQQLKDAALANDLAKLRERLGLIPSSPFAKGSSSASSEPAVTGEFLD